MDLIAVLTWCLWTARNQMCLGGARQSAISIVQWVWSYLEEYQFANYIPTQPRSDSEVYWSPPKPPWFKVNVEGAVFSSLKSVGVGIVIWDHCGQVAAAMSRSLDVPLGPLETQAKAMEEAILFAKDTGFHDVIF